LTLAAPAAAAPAAVAPAAAAAARLVDVEAGSWALVRFVLDARFPLAGGRAGVGGGGGVLRALVDARRALARFAAEARLGLAALVDFDGLDFPGLDFVGPAERTRDARGCAVAFRPDFFLVAMIGGRSAPLIPCLSRAVARA